MSDTSFEIVRGKAKKSLSKCTIIKRSDGIQFGMGIGRMNGRIAVFTNGFSN